MSAQIPTSEIQQDIADTVKEIEWMSREIEHFEATPSTSPDYRWNMMRASARRTGISERREFVAKLNRILTERAQKEQP